MDFLKKACDISQEFADYIADIAEFELRFQGEHPIEHSRDNHVHLYWLVRRAQHDPRLDLKTQVQAIEYILPAGKYA